MNTREYDLEVIRRGTLSSDPNERKRARVALERIRHEGSEIKSMREALLKATRDGNKEEIKDIHDFIRNRPEYQTWGRKQVWRE
jgi:hypothetical protein